MNIVFELKIKCAPLFPDEIDNITWGFEQEYDALNKMQKFLTNYYEDPSIYIPEIESGEYIIQCSTYDRSDKGISGDIDKTEYVLSNFRLLSRNGPEKGFEVTPLKKVKIKNIKKFDSYDHHHSIAFYE